MPELTCIRLLDAEAPAGPLAEAVRQVNAGQAGPAVFTLDPVSFEQVPNAPFAYWVEEKARKIFKEFPPFESQNRNARVGDHPGDSFRYIRLWWEVDASHLNNEWKPYQKGGVFSPYYSDIHLVVQWDDKNKTYKGFTGREGRSSTRPSNYEYFFRPGITWPRRTTSGMSARILPRGCVFADKGPAAFVSDDHDEIRSVLAVMQSSHFAYLVSMQLAAADSAARSYEVGLVQRTPVPLFIEPDQRRILSAAVSRLWGDMRKLDTFKEISHAFVAPWIGETLVQLKEHEGEISKFVSSTGRNLSMIQDSIDAFAEEVYGFKVPVEKKVDTSSVSEDSSEDEEQVGNLDASRALASYLVGIAFGRWAISANPEELRKPPEDPFAPLPPQAPGAAPVAAAKLYFVEDASGESPLLNACRDALRQATGLADISYYEQDLAARLEVPSLRDYLGRPAGFFADHLSVYSKSRRKAPIYWPLSTRSGDFVIWVYYPKLDADSLPRLITEVLDPRLRCISEELAGLAGDGKAGARKAQLEVHRLELAEMRQDFQDLVAKGYKPYLNDGVLTTACPLAKYFRLPKFRKDLEDCWKKLSKGEYDWSHLAMSMWPDRVLAACRCDRSIAIAHGKEELCPVEHVKVTRGRKKKAD